VYYVRDLSGEVLAVYTDTVKPDGTVRPLSDHPFERTVLPIAYIGRLRQYLFSKNGRRRLLPISRLPTDYYFIQIYPQKASLPLQISCIFSIECI